MNPPVAPGWPELVCGVAVGIVLWVYVAAVVLRWAVGFTNRQLEPDPPEEATPGQVANPAATPPVAPAFEPITRPDIWKAVVIVLFGSLLTAGAEQVLRLVIHYAQGDAPDPVVTRGASSCMSVPISFLIHMTGCVVFLPTSSGRAFGVTFFYSFGVVVVVMLFFCGCSALGFRPNVRFGG